MYLHNLLLVLLVVISGAFGSCPEPQDVFPCTCRTLVNETGQGFSILTCEGLQSEQQLMELMRPARLHDISELELISSKLKFFPHDAFVDTSLKILSMHNSSISSLSDTGVAFEGLEDSLQLIEVINCSFVNEWDWHQMAHLNRLGEVQVTNSELLYVTEGIVRIAHLDIKALTFQQNHIVFLQEFVFSPFENIQRIALDGNEIRILRRTMFPRPAPKLRVLGLSSNNIRNLPKDLFTDMPALKSIYLTGNPLQTIDELTFKPVWNQLHLFLFHATPLSCDCRLVWLAMSDNSGKFIHAVCQSPTEFKGRHLFSMKAKELWC